MFHHGSLGGKAILPGAPIALSLLFAKAVLSLHSLITSSQDSEVEASDTRETSLVVQWLRIHFPLQGTRIQPLWATKPSLCKDTQHSQTSKQNNSKEQ